MVGDKHKVKLPVPVAWDSIGVDSQTTPASPEVARGGRLVLH